MLIDQQQADALHNASQVLIQLRTTANIEGDDTAYLYISDALDAIKRLSRVLEIGD